MNQHSIFMSDLMLKLADRLKERLAFDIADGAAHFDNRNTVLSGIVVKAAFDLIGDVRDDLYRASAEVTVAFFLKYGPVNLSGCHIGIAVEAFVNETLVVPKIQVCLRAVVCDEDFPVLDRVHGSRVYVDVRIKFLHGDFVPSRL